MDEKILVVGATGHVGSQIVRVLAERGHPVRAFVRKPDDRVHDTPDNVEYVVGDLANRQSLARAVEGIHTVLSTANGIVPKGATQSVADMNDAGYTALIEEAEAAGVRHFIQSSVPSHHSEWKVDELSGKRQIEARLGASSMGFTIVRNPAFMDVWLVMAGAKQAMGSDPHATTRRPYGFQRMWQRMTGNLVNRYGIMLAPGGRDHGSPLIATKDVAEMMAGVVGKQSAYGVTIEAGGPEWLTWGDVADLLSKQTGRRVRVVPMPAWFAGMGRVALKGIWPSASNVLALTQFIATYQPPWQAPDVVKTYDLPPQTTVADYLKENWET